MAQRVLADKAYARKTWARKAWARKAWARKAWASKANRAALKGKHRDGILHKAVREGCARRLYRGRPRRQSQKRFNRMISKHWFRVEQCFGTRKRLFVIIVFSGGYIAPDILGSPKPMPPNHLSDREGHGRHLAEPPQGCKQDNIQPVNPGNRMNHKPQNQSASNLEAEPKNMSHIRKIRQTENREEVFFKKSLQIWP